MKIGTVTEIKDDTETRVGLTPQSVKELTARGHEILVQKRAGRRSQISDEEYQQAGAEIVDNASEVWGRVDLMVNVFGADLRVLKSTKEVLTQEIEQADIIIGSIYIKGARADKLINREMLDIMREGAVIGDVAIDQGGICEFSKITDIKEPSIIIRGPQTGKKIIYLGIPNIPATVGATATQALNAATREYVKKYAEAGLRAVLADPAFQQGINVAKGYITSEPVAKAHNLEDKFKEVKKVFE